MILNVQAHLADGVNVEHIADMMMTALKPHVDDFSDPIRIWTDRDPMHFFTSSALREIKKQ